MSGESLLLQRARGEYAEMPGLSLTLAQACRLWRLDQDICRDVLDQLSRQGYLVQLRSGKFVLRHDVPSAVHS